MSRTSLVVAPLIVMVLFAAACGGRDDSQPTSVQPGGLSFVIQVSDNTFTPSTLTVPSGTSVTWQWSGKNEHSVVGNFGAGQVSSPEHKGRGEFSLALHAIGTWHYHCGVHGQAMSGTIVVN
jgi:plastocyanin